MAKIKKWDNMAFDLFLEGCGMQRMFVNTKYLRIFKQCFSREVHVKPHSHANEWEIVLGGPKKLVIYRPGVEHELFWPEKDESYFIISIKIGKKP